MCGIAKEQRAEQSSRHVIWHHQRLAGEPAPTANGATHPIQHWGTNPSFSDGACHQNSHARPLPPKTSLPPTSEMKT